MKLFYFAFICSLLKTPPCSFCRHEILTYTNFFLLEKLLILCKGRPSGNTFPQFFICKGLLPPSFMKGNSIGHRIQTGSYFLLTFRLFPKSLPLLACYQERLVSCLTHVPFTSAACPSSLTSLKIFPLLQCFCSFDRTSFGVVWAFILLFFSQRSAVFHLSLISRIAEAFESKDFIQPPLSVCLLVFSFHVCCRVLIPCSL